MMNNTENLSNEQSARLFVLLLKEIAKEKGITQQEIAEKTGLHQSNIARVFSVKFIPSFKNFIAIAKAIGIEIILK